MRPIALSALILAGCSLAFALLSSGAARAADDPAAHLADLLAPAPDTRTRVIWLGEIAYGGDADPALRDAARERFEREYPIVPQSLIVLFDRVTPEAQALFLDLHRERWDVLGRNTNPLRDEMVRRGLFSNDADVRQAAAVLAATRPFPRVIHHAIDAANLHPELVPHAVRAVGANRDERGLRWLIETAAHGDQALRDTGLWSIYSLGPKARSRLFEYAVDEDPAVRRFVVEGLLLIAGPDELSLLYRWVDDAGSDDPDLASRVLEAIAAIEAGRYRPEPPAPIDLESQRRKALDG